MSPILQLKKSNCKNCYKCIRACPVKSIRFTGHQAHIIPDECILCGMCFVVCPQNAKQVRNDLARAKELIASGRPVVVSMAPSFIADFEVDSFAQMDQALRQLGFHHGEETAIGAHLVKTQYEEMVARRELPVIISSCCHSVNLLIEKYFPRALPFLAPVLSPMLAHAKLIKEQMPDAAVVFIGPCVSKKDEGEKSGGLVDCVLTFDGLREWLAEESIQLDQIQVADDSQRRSRFFPTRGGILRSMDQETGTGYRYFAVDGAEECIAALKEVESGTLTNCFIEMSICKGSCIGGPVTQKYRSQPMRCNGKVEAYAGHTKEDFVVAQPPALEKTMPYLGVNRQRPGEWQIREVLAKMGKTLPEHELNCGSCGYPTCREKAIAVCEGKADLTMCLPFLLARAESFSDTIINNTPNAIIVMDERLEIQQLNRAACQLLGIRDARSAIGNPIVNFLGPIEYLQVMDKEEGSSFSKHYLPEYDKYVEESIVFDKDYHVVISIMRDITQQEKKNEELAQLRLKTVEVTDRVIDKQMRVAQEIASLLGETTAETKIALTKLKDTLQKQEI